MNHYTSHYVKVKRGKASRLNIGKGNPFTMNMFSPLLFMLSQDKRTKDQSKFMAGKFREEKKYIYFASQHGAPLQNSTLAESNFRDVVFKGEWNAPQNAGC